jgi:hypothetical protein
LLRAAHARLRFASTGKITVHKFAAGHRYLSYLRVSSDEQREFLRKLTLPLGIDVVEIISKSNKNGQYMAMQYLDFSAFQEGYLFEQNRKNKGISRPALQPLIARVLFEQTDESRALDWHGVETAGKRYRWSGPNPRPKILIPYTGNRARISVEVISKNPDVQIEELSLFVEDYPADCKIETDTVGVFHLVADIQLQSADYTVLTLDAPTFRPSDLGLSEDQRRIGIAVSDIIIAPIE